MLIESIPAYLHFFFGLTVVLTIGWFYWASKSKYFLLLALIWIAIQSTIASRGTYEIIEYFPPKLFLFGILPCLLMISICFATKKGRVFIDSIDLKILTNFHTVRIPVEIVLLLLFYQGQVSQLMTFEGSNFDILSGLSAAIVAYIAFRKSPVNKKLLLWWNIICLVLLFNVVVTAILALPSPFQIFSLDQPNEAVLHFPFSLLPTFIVPLVLFAHLVAFRQVNN